MSRPYPKKRMNKAFRPSGRAEKKDEVSPNKIGQYADPGSERRVSMEEKKEKDSRLWGMLCHLSALSAFLGIPFAHILGPLIVWLIKKDEFPFVDDQGKESLNFQISMTAYGVVVFILCFVFVGFLLLPILVVVELILVIVASVSANRGETYRYPFTIRFIK